MMKEKDILTYRFDLENSGLETEQRLVLLAFKVARLIVSIINLEDLTLEEAYNKFDQCLDDVVILQLPLQNKTDTETIEQRQKLRSFAELNWDLLTKRANSESEY